MSDDAKLAVVTARQEQDREQLADHEARLRLVERAVVSLSVLPTLVEDLERRQRKSEERRWPLPTLGALTGAIGALTGVAALLLELWR